MTPLRLPRRGDDDRDPGRVEREGEARAGVAPGARELAAGVRSGMTDRERLLDELRPVAFAIAYRMLGSVSEAEDVVQEALLRVHQEPIITDGEDDPARHAETADSLSLAMLVLLERLSPEQRAVLR
jgi:DNA-directed RNA polymerase specialized sigma24 family protein